MSKKTKRDLTREIAEELDTFDQMLSTLVELLEEKGILTEQEWESRIRSKLHKRDKPIMSYREIQFANKET